jgi:hypothetical protein
MAGQDARLHCLAGGVVSTAGRQVWNWREDAPAARRARRLAVLRRRGLVQGLVAAGVGTVLNLVLGHVWLGRVIVLVGAVQTLVALHRPALLEPVFRLLLRLGHAVGRGLAWLLLAPLWLLVFVPTGAWLRWRRRDPLHRAPLAPDRTAWIPRRQQPGPDDAIRQFLQEDREARALVRPVGSLPDPGSRP